MMILVLTSIVLVTVFVLSLFALGWKIEERRDVQDSESESEIEIRRDFTQFRLKLDKKDVAEMRYPITLQKKNILRCSEKVYGIFSVLLIISELRGNGRDIVGTISTSDQYLETNKETLSECMKKWDFKSKNYKSERILSLIKYFLELTPSRYENMLTLLNIPFSTTNDGWLVFKLRDFRNFSFKPINIDYNHEKVISEIRNISNSFVQQNHTILTNAFKNPEKISFTGSSLSEELQEKMLNITLQEHDALIGIIFGLYNEFLIQSLEEFINKFETKSIYHYN